MDKILDIQTYVDQVLAVYAQGNATEHSYRSALKSLFDSIEPTKVSAQNEPKRQTDVGAPDFSFHRHDKTGGKPSSAIVKPRTWVMI